MGYGGALIWTGLTRNLKNQFPNKKIILKYKPSLKDLLLFRKNPDFQIYINNPDIELVTNSISWFLKSFFYKKEDLIVINLEEEKYHYWLDDTKEKMSYKQKGHAIAIACSLFELPTVELRTRLDLEKKEIEEVEKLLNINNLQNKKYICIEPNSKQTFTNNKQWPLAHWQNLINLLSNYLFENKLDYRIVQIGIKGSPLLKGVVDLIGTTSFRQIKKIIENSSLVIANEGGIGHLTASSNTKGVIICNPSLPKDLMAYPQYINILPENGIHNCGFKRPCSICYELLASISPEFVFEKVKLELLNKK